MLHNYCKPSAQYSALRKKITKKYTHAGSLVNTTLPVCCIYHFSLQNLQSSAQKYQNAEDFCSIIIETRLYKATESP